MRKARKVICQFCGQPFEASRSSSAKGEGGFRPGTKGAYIYELLKQHQGISKADLQRKMFDKFGSDCVGRINNVITLLRQRGKLVYKDGKYFLLPT